MRPLTVLSWNVETFAPEALAAVVARFGRPEIVCVQEVRVRPQDLDDVARLTRALPGYGCGCSLARDPRNATFRGGRVYGVATYVRSAGRTRGAGHRTLDWDREGRVLVTDLPSLGVAIVNVYAVNGTSKPYWDHELGRFDGDRHAFKRRFVERVGDEAARLRELPGGRELVLVGDWNVSRTRLDTWPRLRTEEPHARARRELDEVFLPRLDLVDAFRHLHPDARKYTWFNRRAPPGRLDAARVDYALVSRTLLPRLVEADIDEAPDARPGSDHAPLWVRLAAR